MRRPTMCIIWGFSCFKYEWKYSYIRSASGWMSPQRYKMLLIYVIFFFWLRLKIFFSQINALDCSATIFFRFNFLKTNLFLFLIFTSFLNTHKSDETTFSLGGRRKLYFYSTPIFYFYITTRVKTLSSFRLFYY